jgi:PII-like signaling protein
MLSIIDSEEQIHRLIPHLDAMVEEGLIAMSSVDVIRYSRVAEKIQGTLSGKAQ